MYPANINTNNIYEVHPTVEYLVKTCPDESRNFLVVKTGQYARDEFELQYGLDNYIMKCGESGLQELFESIHPDYDQIKKRVLSSIVSSQSSVVSQLPVVAPTTHNSQPTTHTCANHDLICQLKDFFTIKINVLSLIHI